MALPTIPGYTLEDLLGAGSCGRVYAARDPQGRAVAVKVLGGPGLDLERIRDRLEREIGVLRAVAHPALAPLWDAATEAPLPYLVFPRYSGGDLKQRLTQGALDPPLVRALALRLAGALDALHAAGAVHRDVKPANVFLDAEGCAVLGDLGLVRAEGHEPLTTEGLALGSIPYMAPEVRQGHRATPATDMFALGVLLLEAAGGGRPVITADAVVVPFQGRPPGLGPETDALVRRLLAPDPARRPKAGAVLEAMGAAGVTAADAATMSLALAAAPRHPPAAAPRPTGPAAPRSGPRASFLVPMAILAGLALWALGWTPAPARPPLPPPRPPPTPALPPTHVAGLLRDLESRLGEEEAALEAGSTARPGQAHVLRWLAQGNDPRELPELVRSRLRRHQERLRREGAADALGARLEDPPVAPGSPASRRLAAEAAALVR